ncbi:hypothetical protein ID866_8302 [Astraeus odoratus]|nr:hypothetical protein ID866_8302 [Astraeus odoratus]
MSVVTQSVHDPQSDVLRAQIFQRLHPHAYLDRFLVEGIRPDGRTPEEWRDVFINIGAWSIIRAPRVPRCKSRMGGTTIVCGVKAEIAEPELDTPDEGFIVPNIDLLAMCSSKFKPGPPSEEAQVLSERLNAVLVSAQFVPLTTLCIEPGRSVWCLYVDTTCINYDGNVFDAALLAIVAALRNTEIMSLRGDVNQYLEEEILVTTEIIYYRIHSFKYKEWSYTTEDISRL